MPEPYGILGVDAGASEAAIKAAFRRAAKRYHPDLNAGDRAGERRLGRLMAARDFLLSHHRRFLKRKPAGDLLRLGAAKGRRASLMAGGLIGVGFLALLLIVSPPSMRITSADEPFQTSVIVEVEEAPIPDAESAGVKAIRDLREFPGTEPAQAAKALTDGAPWDKPGAPASVSRHTPRSKKGVTGVGAAVARTWRRLASKLGGS
jgi:curved DNA-binding protein CbpA